MSEVIDFRSHNGTEIIDRAQFSCAIKGLSLSEIAKFKQNLKHDLNFVHQKLLDANTKKTKIDALGTLAVIFKETGASIAFENVWNTYFMIENAATHDDDAKLIEQYESIKSDINRFIECIEKLS